MLARRLSRLCGLLLLVGLCRPASAHPMGNFSVNHYSKIEVRSDRVVVRYFIDLAEIPTYQELQQANLPTSGLDPNSAAAVRYAAARGAELARGLVLEVDSKPLPLRMLSSGVVFPPGAGGLPTMKMGFVYEYPIPPTADLHQLALRYADNNYPGHAGWKEIVAFASAGSLLRSSAPAKDRSGELGNYPTDLLNSPPQDLEASLLVALPSAAEIAKEKRQPASAGAQASAEAAKSAPLGEKKARPRHASAPTSDSPLAAGNGTEASPPAATAAVRVEANRQRTPRSKFTELVAEQHLSAWFLFTAAFIAAGLGGLHALEPGHGKTIVAAYLVGSKGTARHAFLLGAVVTLSHTAGVFALGAVTLYASRYIVPEQLYPWLGAFSGITIAGLGFYMLLRRLSGGAAEHSHAPGAAAGHSPFGHWARQFADDAGRIPTPASAAQSAGPARSLGLAELFALGITGGIVPCPAALIVLLSAIALHRVGFGLFLIVAFSAGLAAVLIGFGMAMVSARRFMGRLQMDGPLTRRWLPAASSASIAVLGLILAYQAFSSMHLQLHMPPGKKMGPALLVSGLGLLLGMRHSTDADHVVAISTIVSKQRSIRNAAFIGSVWGLGHTITIFVVGSLIILFGVEIPPRLGLSMEFCVALMLILLGVLNLTGVLRKATAYFTPATAADGDLAAAKPRTKFFARLEASVSRLGWYHFLRPLAIGLVHGLAGSAAVALLVLSTIHDPAWATLYLLIFGAGTLVGMMCMTAAMALPLAYAGDRFSVFSRYLGVASGMVSLCFGSFLVYQLGFVGGLFTSHPHWTPQ